MRVARLRGGDEGPVVLQHRLAQLAGDVGVHLRQVLDTLGGGIEEQQLEK